MNETLLKIAAGYLPVCDAIHVIMQTNNNNKNHILDGHFHAF